MSRSTDKAIEHVNELWLEDEVKDDFKYILKAVDKLKNKEVLLSKCVEALKNIDQVLTNDHKLNKTRIRFIILGPILKEIKEMEDDNS